jgi:cytochrome c biogenesis protein CcdA
MFFLILFAFLAGVVTVLSPCILPLLPIILSSSVDASGKKKPLGVITGFVISFTFFTLFLSAIVRSTGIAADTLRSVSVYLIIFFGLTLLLPKFQLYMELLFAKLARFAPSTIGRSGYWGGLLIGFSLGLLWTPCVGPILASVISLAITGQVNVEAFLITLAYSTGTAIPMFVIMNTGSAVLQKNKWLINNSSKIQKVFGVLMIITALLIFFNFDRRFQSYVLEKLPRYGTNLTFFEEASWVRENLNKLKDN